MKVRRVPSSCKYSDTRRRTRLALLSESAAPFDHFKLDVVLYHKSDNKYTTCDRNPNCRKQPKLDSDI